MTQVHEMSKIKQSSHMYVHTDTLFTKSISILVTGCSSGASCSGTAAEQPCGPSVSTARVYQPCSSGCVLTSAVLQMQRETIESVREVAKELREIKT